MKKYKKFLSPESFVELKKPMTPKPLVTKQKVMETPKVETIKTAPIKEAVDNAVIDSGDNLKGIVLMLNQVLSELNTVNKKLEEAKIAPVSMPTEKVVENVEKGVRSKISLIRDESGKITGADVIDSVQE